jgi:hypothetical protein
VAALVVFIELVGLGRAEGRVIVAAEDAWRVSSACEKSENSLQVIEEGVLIACFYWVAKEVFAASITKCYELAVSLDTLGADWSDVVVADAFSDVPLGVLALGFEGW